MKKDGNKTESWETLRKYQSLIEAQMAQSYLQSHGFETELLDKHFTRLYGLSQNPFSGLRLQVKKKDYIKAKHLLENVEKNSDKSNDLSPTNNSKYNLNRPQQIRQRLLRIGTILFLLSILAIFILEAVL